MQVGLREVPVVIRDVDDNEVMELALVENLQRKDLTAFEEAEALQQLAQKCGYTHEDMARKLGKSRTAITESLSLNNMPDEVRNLCRLADITVEVDAAADRPAGGPARRCWRWSRSSPARAARRARTSAKETAKAKAGTPEAVRVRVQAADKGVQPATELHARRKVDKAEIIAALEDIIRELKTQAYGRRSRQASNRRQRSGDARDGPEGRLQRAVQLLGQPIS